MFSMSDPWVGYPYIYIFHWSPVDCPGDAWALCGGTMARLSHKAFIKNCRQYVGSSNLSLAFEAVLTPTLRRGGPMGCLWDAHRIHTNCHGLVGVIMAHEWPTGWPRDARGMPLGGSRGIHRIRLRCQWDAHGLVVIAHVGYLAHGLSMRCP